MKVKHLSLREAVVLPIAQWFKGQAHAHSTFIHGDVNLPGFTMEEQEARVVIFCDGNPVAAIPLSNVRGYTYLADEVPAEEIQVTEMAEASEAPRRKARA